MWNPWEWLKLLYENWGHKQPAASALALVIVFALLGFLVWWRLDAQYWKDHPAPSIASATFPSPAQPANEAGAHPLPTEPERIFVPGNISVEYLVDLYEANTSLQADKLASNYIGKWMKVSAMVANVAAGGSAKTIIVESGIRHSSNRRLIVVLMYFGPAWFQRVSMLIPNSPITVLGKLQSISSDSIALVECELASKAQ